LKINDEVSTTGPTIYLLLEM